MNDAKVLRVVGQSSTVLFNANDPYAPINRRISIIVLNKRTEDAIMNDGKTTEVQVSDADEVAAQTGASVKR